ncbi:hypothetical protein [Streptomyces sp. ISL-11]|uniref:hypothetical protein n=1 Tax=Streptomyces sp. ISL-11 TaxID=2819174 RepID=UPI001BE6FE5A|nr:hypothetical protein [Streptomyces sp. ISL-11]MBT2385805.1 hypothetical protein [Streptomyces sp. ISL-11]
MAGASARGVLRQHHHCLFEGVEQRGRAAIATMLTPGADDPTERAEVARPAPIRTAPGIAPGAVSSSLTCGNVYFGRFLAMTIR